MPEETKKPAEPRDAASLIMLKGAPDDPEVLVGRRPEKARFMPSVWVFPGGAVEEASSTAPPGNTHTLGIKRAFSGRLPTRTSGSSGAPFSIIRLAASLGSAGFFVSSGI